MVSFGIAMRMPRRLLAVIAVLLGEALLFVGWGYSGHLGWTDPPPAVICPKTVLLRTPDSSGYGSLEMSVAFSSDGLTVAAGRLESSGTVVSLRDVASGRETGIIKGNGTIAEACAVAFSPDGRTLAVGEYQGVSLYDPVTGQIGGCQTPTVWRRQF